MQIGTTDTTTISDHCELLKGTLTSAAKEKLSLTKKKNQDWFADNSGELEDLPPKKRDACIAVGTQPGSAQLAETHKELRAEVQKKT